MFGRCFVLAQLFWRRRRLMKMFGLNKNLHKNSLPKKKGNRPPINGAELKFHLTCHIAKAIAKAEQEMASVDLDMLAEDLGIKITEDAFLLCKEECEAKLEEFYGTWYLTILDGLTNDQRRVLVSILIIERIRGNKLIKTSFAQALSRIQSDYPLALSLLVPPKSAQALHFLWPNSPETRARRLRVGTHILHLAERGNVAQ